MPPAPRFTAVFMGTTRLALAALALLAVRTVAVAHPTRVAGSAALRTELAELRDRGAPTLPDGVHESLAFQVDVAERIAGDFAPQAEAWLVRAARMAALAKSGKDPFLEARGQILMRGYRSPISSVRQGYAIYLPKNYDAARAYPLVVALHGGSAGGNLFLGVVLGNNMNWKEYDKHLWDEFVPRWTPECIVVAPDGFGQVMWRFMGEQDVLDVIADVQKHYAIDEDRIALLGLSNGGVGAYTVGLRHAHRFSAVIAIAGAPSWLQYAGGAIDPFQAEALHPLSGMSLAENAIDTDFRYFHGRVDPGPMRPAFVEEFGKRIATLGVPYKEQWYDAGHDLLYMVLRHGRLFDELAAVVRKRHPREVRVVTGDYRAARQHWVTVTEIERFPALARVRAVVDGSRLRVETTHTLAFVLDLQQAPLAASGKASLDVDGQVVHDGARDALGNEVALVRDASGRWRIGGAAQGAADLRKKPGSSGPITDAYFDSILHVYGTAIPEQTEGLRKAAQRGAHGWPLWLWRVEQPVLADTELTDELMQRHHVVLYGTPGANRVLSRIEADLPIRVQADAVVVGGERFTGKGVGTKLIYPNPLARGRYVIVQAAPTLEGVLGGNELPDFLPDYVVYDAQVTATRPRLLFDRRRPPLALGTFDEHWRLDPAHTQRAMQRTREAPTPASRGNDPESARYDAPPSRLPVPASPPLPPPPTHFLTEAATPTGKVAREIARRVQRFTNYRAKITGARWKTDPACVWSIREPAPCMEDLKARGVRVTPWTGVLQTPVAVPVRVDDAVQGVTFRMMHAGAGGVVSCELAARLIDIANVVKAHGVHTVYVLSAYRAHPHSSFHTLGLALDLSRFDTAHGALVVKTDFVLDRDHETCEGPEPRDDKARTLRAIACELAATRRFSSVLTPNYNVGHRDHLHLDVRPDDPRLFLR